MPKAPLFVEECAAAHGELVELYLELTTMRFKWPKGSDPEFPEKPREWRWWEHGPLPPFGGNPGGAGWFSGG